MQKRWEIYLLSLIFSYLLIIKLGLNSVVQPIRLTLTGIILLEAAIYSVNTSSNKLKFPSVMTGLFAFYLFVVIISYPLNLMFNLGSIVKYSCYMLVFLAAFNGFNLRTEKLFGGYFLLGLYAVSFVQLFTGDTEYINMVERVSGVYYRHSSGMALFLTILFGHVLYKSNKSWSFIHLLIISYLLLKTGSRSGVIAVIVAWLVVELFKGKNWKLLITISITLYLL